MRRVRWSKQALNDLLFIGRYIASRNPGGARRLLARLRARVNGMTEFPFSGRMVPEFMRKGLREVIEGNYRIVYEVSDDWIDVVTVFESHRLFPLEEDEEKDSAD